LSDLINRIFLTGPDLVDLLFSMALSTIVGLLISQLYRGTHRGLNYEHTFMASLVMLAPIVTLVMLFIRGDLVLSLGLIGSLSIIRFRTAVKDTRDMVFIFWVIAVGLGAGTYNWSTVLVASLFVMLVVVGLFYIRYGHTNNADFVLAVTGSTNYEGEKIRETVQGFTTDARMRTYEVEDGHWEVIYELRLKDLTSQSADELIAALKAMKGVQNISLLAPQISLPL
jgi:hypothetical protein